MTPTGRTATVGGIAATIGQVARDWSRRLETQLLARQLVALAGSAEPRALVPVVYQWLADRVVYTQEEPEVVVGLGPLLAAGAGDCDDTAAAVAAILLALGYRVDLAIGTRAGRPVHVWTLALAPGSARPVEVDVALGRGAGVSPLDVPETRLDGVILVDLAGRRIGEGQRYAG